jgi:hypothetical protein
MMRLPFSNKNESRIKEDQNNNISSNKSAKHSSLKI